MKRLLLLITFSILCLISFAQINLQQDHRVNQIVKSALASNGGYCIYGRAGASRFINIAVLNQTSHTLCWFTCHGRLFDSTKLTGQEFEQIASKQIDPFELYQNICSKYLTDLAAAKDIYRVYGDVQLLDKLNGNYRALFAMKTVQAAQTPLQKLIAIENIKKKILTQLAYLNCASPFLLHDEPVFKISREQAGAMIQTKDSTVYYNIDPTSAVAKINLYKKSAGKLYIQNRFSEITDSVAIQPEKYDLLQKEKTDVFLLYRGWLEMQWQGTLSAIRRQSAGVYRQVNVQNEKEIRELYNQLNAIGTKINQLNSPEAKSVEQSVYDTYKNETSEVNYIPLLGIGYNLTQTRGQKEYELTNHLGNVLTTVSDKKIGVSSSSDSFLIDHYEPDVVSAQDYYPFGMLQPGHSYLSSTASKYRYGFNGKENDNEVKGGGTQQDYGMRMYDPRLGKFLSVDPLTLDYAWNSPYSFAEGDVMRSIDLDGLEKYIVYRELNDNNELVRIVISSFLDKDGNVRDNEIYKYNPKFKKADVYVINENVNTQRQIGKIKYQKELNKDQATVFKQFGVKKPLRLKSNETGSFFEIKTNIEGTGIGNTWQDGYEKDAYLDLISEVNLVFQKNSDAPANDKEYKKLEPIAKILKAFPNSKVEIIGNGGTDDGNPGNAPIGNGPAAMNADASLNGQITTTKRLLEARAVSASTMLKQKYSIDTSRIRTSAGTMIGDSSGRRVDIKVSGVSL